MKENFNIKEPVLICPEGTKGDCEFKILFHEFQIN